MKFKDYKGYEIKLNENDGMFYVENTACGQKDTLKKVEDYIDSLLKAESSGKFPIEAIDISFNKGKITSFNKLENNCWFVKENGDRSKNSISTNYSGGQPRYFAINENNLKLLKRHNEIEDIFRKLGTENRSLEKQITEPIDFSKL